MVDDIGLKTAPTPIWLEARVIAEAVSMFLSPSSYGLGLPRGQKRAILLLPGHRANDVSMQPLWWSLTLRGERPFFSELASTDSCFEEQLEHCKARVDYIRRLTAHRDQRVHIVGWSLGGLIGGALKKAVPDKIGRLITLGTPQNLDSAVHPLVALSGKLTGDRVRQKTGKPKCWTAECNCFFVEASTEGINPDTCVYSPLDGIVDGAGTRHSTDPNRDRAVLSSHLGMGFVSSVHRAIAEGLEGA